MNSNHSFEWLNSFPVHGHTTLYVFSIHFEFCVLFSVIKNVAKNIFVHESFHIYKYNYRIFLAVEWICILIWIQYCLIALQTQSTFLPTVFDNVCFHMLFTTLGFLKLKTLPIWSDVILSTITCVYWGT